MSRYVKRVPKNFKFTLDQSYTDFIWRHHVKDCDKEDHNTCGVDDKPPKGEGWQLWQGVSDGPVTPVFDTAEELLDYMSQPVPYEERPHYDLKEFPDFPTGRGWHRKAAEMLVGSEGWVPSGAIVDGRLLDMSELIEHVHGEPKR